MSSPILLVSIAASIAVPNRCTGLSFSCTGLCPAPGRVLASRLAEALLEVPLDLSAQVPIGDLAAAVPPLLALRQRELDLRPRALEVDPGRDQGQSALGRLADQPLDLAAMEEELAGPVGIVVLVRRRQIGRDVGAAHPHLAAIDHRVGLVDLRLAVAERLHLASAQLDAGLHLLQHLELVPCAAVGGDVPADRGPLALLLLCHQASTGIRSTRPRGDSTRSTVTLTGSPMRIASPPPAPISIVSLRSSS